MNPREQVRKPGEPGLQRALWSGLILILIGVVGAGTWSLVRERMATMRAPADRPSHLPIYGSVPDFSLIERSGRRVERSALLGKIWVINFMYTRCPDTCPLQSAEMARLQADLATESDFRLVSITVDPKRDTPQVLSRYANRFRADHERWLFLTGEKEVIERLALEGLHLPVGDSPHKVPIPGGNNPAREGSRPWRIHLGQRLPALWARAANFAEPFHWALEPPSALAGNRALTGRVLHSSRFVLIDRKAQIRNYYDSTDMESLRGLRQDVKALLQEE